MNSEKLTHTNDFSIKNWRFFMTRKTSILSKNEIEEMIVALNKKKVEEAADPISSSNAEKEKEKKITTIPHASFIGELILYYKDQAVISFNLQDVLEHAKYEHINEFKKFVADSNLFSVPKKHSIPETQPAFLPSLKIKSKWNEEKMMKKISWGGGIEEIGAHEEDIDWTFTTVYSGSINPKNDFKKCEIIPITNPALGINYQNLSKKENIEFFDEMMFFEDELDDFGFFYSFLLFFLNVLIHSLALQAFHNVL